uniref:HCLS1-associated protein X-1 n=1 Tax=Pectinophora gossypiella TaxID=13191 RepID=A0A1E1WM69_PECGO
MATDTFMEKLRSFFGLRIGVDSPRNDFRNPIWGSDDDDDGDELYTRQNIDVQGHLDLHHEFAKQVHDMFRSFGGMFGDMTTFFQDEAIDATPGALMEPPAEPEHFNSNTIRDYYLKPGYHSRRQDEPKDIDLDGKISSHEISGLLKKKGQGIDPGAVKPFDGNLVPGRSFCQTIITTSVKKPDGTVETRRIVKNGNEVIEETTTSSGPDSRGPNTPGLSPISSTGIIFSELASMFKNFY